VGLTERQARERFGEIRVGRFPFSANGRALAYGEPEGFVKVVVDNKYGEILGVQIVGGAATEMIAEATVILCGEITADEVVENVIHAHPSFSEAFYEACADALNKSVHLPKKKK
jgi:dihydrolipoamide dehydrogenase